MISVPSSSGCTFQRWPSGLIPVPLHSISVPSSSGCTFQQVPLVCVPASFNDFSPLFIGMYVSTTDAPPEEVLQRRFQSPLHRDVRFNWRRSSTGRRLCANFSPLFIGMYVSTLTASGVARTSIPFQSPLHRDVRFNDVVIRGGDQLVQCISVPSSSGCTFQLERLSDARDVGYAFQSPLHRDVRFNRQELCTLAASVQYFSPLFIGMYVSTGLTLLAIIFFHSISVPSSSGCTFQRQTMLT